MHASCLGFIALLPPLSLLLSFPFVCDSAGPPLMWDFLVGLHRPASRAAVGCWQLPVMAQADECPPLPPRPRSFFSSINSVPALRGKVPMPTLQVRPPRGEAEGAGCCVFCVLWVYCALYPKTLNPKKHLF